MKRCPQCARTYSDETLSFCLEDGALLSAPYDPNKTNSPTVVMNAREIQTVEANQIPPTVAIPEILPTVAVQEIPTIVAEKPVQMQTQTEDKKVGWHIYLAGFFIALIYNLVVSVVISVGFRGFFVYSSSFIDRGASIYHIILTVVLSRAAIYPIIFGSLGVMLGFSRYRAKWKWGVVMALAEIPLAFLYIYGNVPSGPPLPLVIAGVIFLFFITFAIGCAATWFGSMLRGKSLDK